MGGSTLQRYQQDTGKFTSFRTLRYYPFSSCIRLYAFPNGAATNPEVLNNTHFLHFSDANTYLCPAILCIWWDWIGLLAKGMYRDLKHETLWLIAQSICEKQHFMQFLEQMGTRHFVQSPSLHLQLFSVLFCSRKGSIHFNCSMFWPILISI